MHIGFIWVHDILTAGVAIDYEKKLTVIYETNISLVCTEFFRPSDYDLKHPTFRYQKNALYMYFFGKIIKPNCGYFFSIYTIHYIYKCLSYLNMTGTYKLPQIGARTFFN